MKTASNESWETYRRKMLAETARFIEWGLRHPDEVIEIPAKPAVNGATWPQRVAGWFWNIALSDATDAVTTRWRDWLRRKPKGLFLGGRGRK